MELYERSDGAEGSTVAGHPIVIPTTVGAFTGHLRKKPVMRVEYEGTYAKVASVGGAATNPSWLRNVLADPRVDLQDGADRRDMTARVAVGDERALWWDRAAMKHEGSEGQRLEVVDPKDGDHMIARGGFVLERAVEEGGRVDDAHCSAGLDHVVGPGEAVTLAGSERPGHCGVLRGEDAAP